MTCAKHPRTGASERSLQETMLSGLVTATRCLAFWTAILVPLLIVPTVLTGGLESHPHVFFGFLALNVVCLVAGHDHRPRDQ